MYYFPKIEYSSYEKYFLKFYQYFNNSKITWESKDKLNDARKIWGNVHFS